MKRREIVYLFSLLLGTVFVCLFFNKCFFGDLSVPFNYQDGDNILTPLSVKRIIENEYLITERMGAPYQSDFFFFPTYADMTSVILIKVLGIFIKNYGVIVNIYYILTYVLIAGTSYWTMRTIKVHPVIAIGASICFASLPYHFLRNTMHLFLSMYMAIPIYILFIYWLCTDEDYWQFNKVFLRNRKNIVTLILLPILALTGIYYSFFACFLFIVAYFIKTGFNQKIFKNLLQCGSIIAVICCTILVASIPYRVLSLLSNENPELVARDPASAEYLGMKITQLFFPNGSHGIWLIDELFSRYSNAPVPNEGSEYLGIYGILGFIVLILVLFGIRRTKQSRRLYIMSVVNISCILLATIGGFGSIFAVLISPQIRAYNRISVYIAFVSMLAISIVLTEWYKKMGKKLQIAFLLVYSAFLMICIYEQSSSVTAHYNDGYIANYYSDKAFIERIEDVTEDGDMIFQYPYLPFPESPNIEKMGDYALARGYLHSDTLRWSYGAYRGTTGDLWIRNMMTCSYEDQMQEIVSNGYSGIYIDRYAYTEDALLELCSSIETYTEVEMSFESDNQRLVFYKFVD